MKVPVKRPGSWTLVLFAAGAAFVASAFDHVQAQAPLPQQTSTPQTAPAATERALLQRYCLTCHNEALKKAGTGPIALDTPDVSNVSANAETWEKVLRKVRTGLMPPPGRPRPDAAALDSFACGAEGELDAAVAAHHH